MTLYLISAMPEVDPILFDRQSQGFIEASSKAKAIAQASRSLSYPYSRLEARTKSEVGEMLWEIEKELFAMLPRFCEVSGCAEKLRKGNRTGYCQKHQEQRPERRKRKPANKR